VLRGQLGVAGRADEIHNELLHDESAAFAIDRKFPESDHAPVVATFNFDD
jgi:exonuclease III